MPEEGEFATGASCKNVPVYLVPVDLDANAVVKVPYFETDLDYVLRLYPVQVVQEFNSDGVYKNWSAEQFLQNPAWFVVVSEQKAIWLTGQGVDTTTGETPAALIFPVFANQSKLALDLQIGANVTVYIVYTDASLPDIVAWIISCGVDSNDFVFFGGQYLIPFEFAQIHSLVPSLQPNR